MRKVVLTKDDLKLILAALDSHMSDHPDEEGTSDCIDPVGHTAIRNHCLKVESKIMTILEERYASNINKIET